MNILGICGSPRKGNTEWMLTTVLNAAGQNGATTELLLLRRTNIKPCRGCLTCEKRDHTGRGACRIDDDMQEILPKLLAADVIVLGTPGYMGLLSGLLKGFLDRTCPIWPALKGKRLAGLTVAEESIVAAMRNLKTYGDLCGMAWAGGITTLAKNPKDAEKKPFLKRRLERLGEKITRLA